MLFHRFYRYFFISMLYRLSRGSSYHVAVVEFGPNLNYNLTPNERLAVNVETYIKIIEETSNKINQTLDLIIFPESTLMYSNTFSETAAQLPPSNDVVLCNSSDKNYAIFLKEFSCAAIQYKTTIVINFTEKETCQEDSLSNCTDSVFYNTNIAIDPKGTIIARYRKWNLFGEDGKSRPNTLDLPIFEINNTTFGMMTCFDIQFGVPAFNLTQQMGVKNIIFPLNWISELPYLTVTQLNKYGVTALQVQQMWAQEFNVTLLAAGASVPNAGAGGSGIYFRNQGSLENDILAKHGTKVIFQTVSTELEAQYANVIFNDDTDESIDILATAMDDFYMLVDPSLIDHNSVVLNISQKDISKRICDGDEKNNLCCDFNISLTMNQNVTHEDDKYYTYHLVAFNGIRTYSKLYYGGVETCGVVACLNSSLVSCGQRFKYYSDIIWPITFNSISITGFFTLSDQRVQFATTLRSSMRPLPLHTISWEKEILDLTVVRKLALKKSQTRLLTFGIFGRDFDRDWDPIRNGTSGNISYKSNDVRITFLFFLLLTTNLFMFRIHYF